MLELGESAVLRTVPPDDQTLAADIILLVDESSSMTMEHAWIPDMTRQLDLALQVMSGMMHPQWLIIEPNQCTWVCGKSWLAIKDSLAHSPRCHCLCGMGGFGSPLRLFTTLF